MISGRLFVLKSKMNTTYLFEAAHEKTHKDTDNVDLFVTSQGDKTP
jgi:hypothetical protein